MPELPAGTTLKKGVYQHYKGPFYEVIDLARHSETEEWVVFYRCLYGDYSRWVRPLSMFIEEVDYQGERLPRFAFVSSSTEGYIDPE